MDMLNQLNAAMDYIESHLCAEWDVEKVAEIACVSPDSFLRFFSYMTGMTLTEYIRRRRLTLAASEIRNSRTPLVDLALQYGWDSSTAFSRAFARQHGLSPSQYRKNGGSLKIYPPASFHITIKGAKEMDFQLLDLQETKLYGISYPYLGQGYTHREELRNRMWSDCECFEDVPGRICLGKKCQGKWNDPACTIMDGVWYGIWQGEREYMIAREKEMCIGENLTCFTLPAGTYACFRTGKGGKAWEEFPRLFDQIFHGWLPSSDYRQKGDLAIEVLHLWADRDKRVKERWYEVWIPVEKK